MSRQKKPTPKEIRDFENIHKSKKDKRESESDMDAWIKNRKHIQNMRVNK